MSIKMCRKKAGLRVDLWKLILVGLVLFGLMDVAGG